MKLIKNWLVIVICLSAALTVNGQTADEVINNHLKVIGQDKVAKRNTKTVKGILHQSGVEVDLYIAQKRGYKMKQELTFNGNKHLVVFNEDKGWEINEFAGHTEPQHFSGEQNMSIKISSDIDSRVATFLKLEGKYSIMDTESVDGKKYHVIKFEIPSYGEEHLWVDANTFMVWKSKKISSGVEKIYSNYKTFDGVLMPVKTLIKLPSGDARVIISEVEFETHLDNTLFKI
ncbi:hypothetical protein [Winogradskyella sp. 3972H.M.0a.05]|uniref:hypothetical protein n=1 Tax=Winogradskyella sp. 3972H.M.0a.05 TaxID=2950277 RepID=UPI003390C3AB